MKIPKWFVILVSLAFGVAIISHLLGTGKNFSTLLKYLNDVKLYNPFEQTMDSAEEFIKGFKALDFKWSSNPFKLVLNVLNYQYKLLINVYAIITLPIRFIYYIVVDLYYMLQAVYDFIR